MYLFKAEAGTVVKSIHALTYQVLRLMSMDLLGYTLSMNSPPQMGLQNP